MDQKNQNDQNFDENGLQSAAFLWFRETYPELRKCLFAVPNGGRRDYRTAGTLKATGVESGVPDMIFLFAARPFCFETKIPGGVQSADQKFFQAQMIKQDIQYYIYYSLDEFQHIMKSIIYRYGKG